MQAVGASIMLLRDNKFSLCRRGRFELPLNTYLTVLVVTAWAARRPEVVGAGI